MISAIGAQHSHGTGAALKLHALEAAFTDLPAVTSIRAAYFMENYAGMIAYARDSGVLPSLLQPLDRAIPMVSVADVGRLVADTLRKSWSGQRVIELEGPQRYAPNDVATALTAVFGRSVKAEALPREHWDQAFRALGFTVGSSKAVAEMIDGLNSNHPERESP
jgi:NAD(P)H dehydrogenase (quinone)